jgi:hypothetical protein
MHVIDFSADAQGSKQKEVVPLAEAFFYNGTIFQNFLIEGRVHFDTRVGHAAPKKPS